MRLLLRLISESFLFAWQALVVNKLRTVLSLLGVTIGIFSIIFVLSVVDSLEADIKQSLDMIGSDILFIQKWPMGPEDGAEEYEWWKYMRRRQPSVEDMEKLRKQLGTYAAAISYQASAIKTAEYGNNYSEQASVLGVSYEYRETIVLRVKEGRYFTPQECDGGRNRAIIGHDIQEQLFGAEEAIGKSIKIGGLTVEVIGVLEKEGASLFGSGLDQAVILPIDFATRLIDVDSQDSSIIIKSASGVTSKELRDEVVATFRSVRGIKPSGDNDFSVIESSMISGAVDNIVGVFNVVGLIIGVFAILVGAFSIANIMFVSVKERTNQIGIQKALGAKNYFVLLQFLFESIALCTIGGGIGLLFVWFVMEALNTAVDFDFILPLARIFMGIGISVSVGVVSGILPALSAARLNPVDAMRAK